MTKRFTAALLLVVLITGSFALSYAESDEDRIAALEARVAKLEQIVISLMASGAEATAEEPTEESETDVEMEKTVETTEEVHMETDEFLTDIMTSYNARAERTERYTNAELNSMTVKEKWVYYWTLVEAEIPFYEKYRNAVFDDKNIQYLCRQYIKGLEKQFNARTIAEETDYKDNDSISAEWQSGYYNRSYVIVELAEYYNVPFSTVAEMKEAVRSLDATNEAEKRNAQVDSALVREVQQLLNDIGFFCGSADGVPGKKTVKSIKRFQEMYGFEPVDGMITEELRDQLQSVLKSK